MKFDFIIKSLLLPVADSLREVFIDTYSESFILIDHAGEVNLERFSIILALTVALFHSAEL